MTCADEAPAPVSLLAAARARWALFVRQNVVADAPAGHRGSLDEREWGRRRDRTTTVPLSPRIDR